MLLPFRSSKLVAAAGTTLLMIPIELTGNFGKMRRMKMGEKEREGEREGERGANE